MFYYGYHFWGMHIAWWFFWLLLLFWILATPFDFPGRTRKTGSPINILKRRFASGKITREEYEACKAILERDTRK